MDRARPLLAQFDFACTRLIERLSGPRMDSGDGTPIDVPPMTDAEYLWEPSPGSWSIRRRSEPPAAGALELHGGGEWGRDAGRPRPWPPPITTIAWRMSHLSELLALRADHTVGRRRMTRADYPVAADASAAIRALKDAAASWRSAVTSADDAALDQVGRCTYPYGSDSEEPFIDVVWWVNQEVLAHGAEIALLRDLYRELG